MDYSDIVDVTHEHGEGGARSMLKKGWVLLAVAAGHDEEGAPAVLYSLGKKKEECNDTI